MLKSNHATPEIIPPGSSGASVLRPVVTLFYAIGFGLILPHILFVNDLSHPIQHGLLFALFPVGRLVGKFVFRPANSRNPQPLVIQGAMLVLSYLLFAAAAMLHPTGIIALRLAQLTWFLIGLFGTNLLFQRVVSDEIPRRPAINLSTLGVPIGALISSALTWTIIRSSSRYDLTQILVPSLAAAAFSAIAMLLIEAERLGVIDSARNSNDEPIALWPRETPRADALDLRSALGVWACANCAVAMACTLTPIMLWETFRFTPGRDSIAFAAAGFLAIAVQLIIRRMLIRSRSSAPVFSIAATGLFLLGVSASALMWAPSTQYGPLAFVGIIALSFGWGCFGPAFSALPGVFSTGHSDELGFALDELIFMLAWIIAPVLASSVFYEHERTSFGLGGVAIALAAIPFASLWWKFQSSLAGSGNQI